MFFADSVASPRRRALGSPVSEGIMTPHCRPARLDDLKPAMAAVVEAFNDVNRRHGTDDFVASMGTGFAAFSLNDDPAGLWVAEDKSEIIGLGFSWTAERLWFLADLFVRPQWQASGVGRVLLRHTLAQAEASGADVKALITFAFNRSSIGLYMRQGLFPRVPLFKLACARSIFSLGSIPMALRMERIGPTDIGSLETIDRSALSFGRGKHHRYLSTDASNTGLIFFDPQERPVAYAYVAANGHVGPIAASSIAYMPEATHRALRVAADQNAEKVSIFLPGVADAELATALDAGLRVQRNMVLMSSRPFGDWTRYAPSDPGFM
jgi:GNAT superfamily N-acetyltransferase